MQRQIVSFGLDDDSHRIAQLDCGHLQHVRHDPPLVSRPWVLSEEGRQTQMGALLDCVQCDRSELPEDFASYKRTPDFTQVTVPAGLRADSQNCTRCLGKDPCAGRPASLSGAPACSGHRADARRAGHRGATGAAQRGAD